MITAFANTMKVPDLRSRILFTLAMIVIVRLGVHLPLPGVDVEALKNYMDVQAQKGDNPLGALGAILTIFSGGGLQQCGIFALGIMPYISASIMTQLMGAVIPSFKKMLREEGGRQKMTKVTRILAIIIAVIQGYLLTLSLRNPANIGLSGLGDLVLNPGFVFTTTTIFIIVTGTMFLMWIGDQITDRGIGNGVSLIISVNIISALPGAFAIAWTTLVGSGTEINPLGSGIGCSPCGNHYSGPAPYPRATSQAHGWPQGHERWYPVPAAQVELLRRDARYLCYGHFGPADYGCAPDLG